MWGGAVNRQPGYRARNLQRRRFLRSRDIPWSHTSVPEDPGSILEFSIFSRFSKKFRSQSRSAGRGITRPKVYVWGWDFACLQLKPISSIRFFLYWKRIQKFSRGTENLVKNPGKLSAKYHRFLPAGCIMWGGAVNRQPGYRARNLERRGWSPENRF